MNFRENNAYYEIFTFFNVFVFNNTMTQFYIVETDK